MACIKGSAAHSVFDPLPSPFAAPPDPLPGRMTRRAEMMVAASPGQQEGAAHAQLFVSQQGALYSTDQGNEARACVEARANPGEKASRNQLLRYRNQRKELTRAQ